MCLKKRKIPALVGIVGWRPAAPFGGAALSGGAPFAALLEEPGSAPGNSGRLLQSVLARRKALRLPGTVPAAAAESLGVAVLPTRLGERLGLVAIDPREIGAAADTPLPVRSIYLVVHRAKQRLPKVRAIVDWLEEVLRD